MSERTVSAISTAQGVGGVAIVRISGDKSLDIANAMFSPVGRTAVKDFKPYRMYAGYILCDGFKDFGLCVYFKAPKSYTGEDIVEFHCHGGINISRGVLKRTIDLGAYPAGRGEFTRRAFLNGKMSLSAAEGLGDMINAESAAEVKAGFMLYSEKLCAEAKETQDILTDCLAGINASLDYPEEDLEEEKIGDVREKIGEAKKIADGLLSTYKVGKMIKSGVNVAICGKPNAGKSSLLNALLGYDKAIVSPYAGTTRDAVEGAVEIEGVRFNLFDTAGIRDGAGEIERVGISAAEKIINAADIVIFVNSGGQDETSRKIEGGLKGKRVIKVVSKTDEEDFSLSSAEKADVYISSVTGEGIEDLKKLLAGEFVSSRAEDGAFIIEERHFLSLKAAAEHMEKALLSSEISAPLDMVASDVKSAWNSLGEITGETATEDIINEIFNKFCVGK